MPDRLSIWHQRQGYSVHFFISGRWWAVSDSQNAVRCWPSAEDVRAFLDRAQRIYQTVYKEPLHWDIEAIPVLEIQGG